MYIQLGLINSLFTASLSSSVLRSIRDVKRYRERLERRHQEPLRMDIVIISPSPVTIIKSDNRRCL